MALTRRRRADEHGTMDIAYAFGVESLRARGGELGLGRRVIDDDRLRVESRAQRRDHLFDDLIVLQDEMNAFRAADGVSRCIRDARAELLERASFVDGAIPGGDLSPRFAAASARPPPSKPVPRKAI